MLLICPALLPVSTYPHFLTVLLSLGVTLVGIIGLSLSVPFLIHSTRLITQPPSAKLAGELIRQHATISGSIILATLVFIFATLYAQSFLFAFFGDAFLNDIVYDRVLADFVEVAAGGVLVVLAFSFWLVIPKLAAWSQQLAAKGIPSVVIRRAHVWYGGIITFLSTTTAVVFGHYVSIIAAYRKLAGRSFTASPKTNDLLGFIAGQINWPLILILCIVVPLLVMPLVAAAMERFMIKPCKTPTVTAKASPSAPHQSA